MKRLAFVAVLYFALGVIVRDVAQDWRDQDREQQLIAQVRGCMYYLVAGPDGKLTCRPMMPRFDVYMPVKPPIRHARAKRKQVANYQETIR